MSLRRTTMNENDRAATGPRRSLAAYGGPIFRRGAEIRGDSRRKNENKKTTMTKEEIHRSAVKLDRIFAPLRWGCKPLKLNHFEEIR